MSTQDSRSSTLLRAIKTKAAFLAVWILPSLCALIPVSFVLGLISMVMTDVVRLFVPLQMIPKDYAESVFWISMSTFAVGEVGFLLIGGVIAATMYVGQYPQSFMKAFIGGHIFVTLIAILLGVALPLFEARFVIK